jgi:hypothetical protein
MLLVGALGLFLLFFLPGLALLRLTGTRFDLSRRLVFAVPLSLLFHHYWVWGATAVGAYSQGAVWGVFVVCALIWLWPTAHARAWDTHIDWDLEGPWRWPEIVAFAAVLLAAGDSALMLVRQSRSIIDGWDAVLSWNRWAVDWYHSQLPTRTYGYPQLLPIIYSLTYQAIGTDVVQFFAKTAVASFELISLLAICDLGLRRRAWRVPFFAAACMYVLLLRKLAGPFSGYADAPLAALMVFPLYCVFGARSEDGISEATWARRLGCATLGVAGLMKPLGLVMTPFLLPLLYPPSSTHSWTPSIRVWSLGLLTVLTIACPWYLYWRYTVANGADESPLGYLISLSRLQWWERPAHGLALLSHDLTLGPITGTALDGIQIAFGGLLVTGAFVSRLNMVLGGYVLAAFLIWAGAVSYDTRNVAAAIPAIAVLIGFGINAVLSATAHVLPALRREPSFAKSLMAHLDDMAGAYGRRAAAALAVIVAIAALALSSLVTSETLHQRQDRLLRQLGNREVASRIYAYHREHPLAGPIITQYEFIRFMPELKEWYRGSDCGVDPTFGTETDVEYFLVMKECGPLYRRVLYEWIRQGRAKRIFSVGSVEYIEVWNRSKSQISN